MLGRGVTAVVMRAGTGAHSLVVAGAPAKTGLGAKRGQAAQRQGLAGSGAEGAHLSLASPHPVSTQLVAGGQPQPGLKRGGYHMAARTRLWG